ncbi:MAG: hypothetical protein WD645_02410, partial [Dehalococcoidia bacterium]
CIYQPRPSHWAMLPASLEWHLAIGLCCLASPRWHPAAAVAVSMWLLSLLVALLQARQAKLAAHHDGALSRVLVMLLCYAQPLVRSWYRQRTRLFSYQRPAGKLPELEGTCQRLPLLRSHTAEYWSEEGIERTHLLGVVIAHLNEHGWSKTIDTGWESWDVEVFSSPWSVVRIATAQEEHGGGKRLIRVRYHTRPSGYSQTVWGLGGILAALAVAFWSWPYAVTSGLLLAAGSVAYWRGARRGAFAVSLVRRVAEDLGLILCGAAAAEPGAPQCDACPSDTPVLQAEV